MASGDVLRREEWVEDEDAAKRQRDEEKCEGVSSPLATPSARGLVLRTTRVSLENVATARINRS